MADVDQLRAAGFTDAEIGAHQNDQRGQLGAAGFSKDEIDQHLGVPEQPKPSLGFLERLKQGTAFDTKLSAFWRGTKAGFGTEPIGMNPDTEKWFQKVGMFPDPETGSAGPIRMLNEALLKPAAAGADAIFRGIGALGTGAAAAVGQAVKDVTNDTSAGNRAERDANAFLQAAPMFAHSAPAFARIERSPMGEIHDVTVAHGLPVTQDFADAAHAMVGNGAKPSPFQSAEAVLESSTVGPNVLKTVEPTGKPGLSLEALAGRKRTLGVDMKGEPQTVVFRDENGAPKGVADFSQGEPTVYVDPAMRRQGIASQMYDFAKEKGINVEATSGSGPMTPDGAAFVNARRAMQQKLETLYETKGLHPAEVAMDAKNDAVLSQDLAADNMPVPRGMVPPAENAALKQLAQLEADRAAEARGEPTAGSPGRTFSSIVEDTQSAEQAYAGGRGPPKPPEPPEPPAPGSPEEAQKKVLDKISVGGRNERPSLTFDDVYRKTVDDLYPLHQAVKAATEGEGLPTARNPYELGRLTRGDAGKADHMLQYGTYDFNTYENNGPGLKQVLAPVGKDLDGFTAYAVASRAVELEGRGIESGIDPEAARQVVAAGKDKYEKPFREFVAYQNRVSAYARDAGVLSKDAYDAMVEANKNFVPFYRVMDDGTAGGPNAGGRSLQARNPFKSIKGSERDIIDPIESAVRNTYTLTAMAERNAVGKALADMPGSGAFLEKVNPPVKGITVTEPEMTKFLDAHGIKDAPDDLLTVFRASKTPLADDEIRVFNDGKPTTYKVDPALALAFKGLDQPGMSLVTRLFAVPAQLLRAGVTGVPEFAARHIFRDYIYAGITSEKLFTPVDMAKGLWGLISKDEDYQAWLKSGGSNNSSVSLDRRYLQENLRQLTSDTGLMTRSWNVIAHPLDGLRAITELAENASHLGAFKKAIGEGASKEDIQAAGFTSRATAVDSARMGASMRAYNMISAFANITVQDTDRVVRAFKDNWVGTTVKVGAGIVLPSAILWTVNNDDTKDPTTGLSNKDRYQEIPEWEKDLFWHVMTQNHIFRIPKPFGTGVLFGSGTERMLDKFAADKPDAFKNFFRSLRDTMIPQVAPVAIAPVLDQFANRSTFTGNPLIPDRLEKLLPEYQYNPYTSETAKALGRIVAAFPGVKEQSMQEQDLLLGGTARALTSPALMENYLRAWTGGMGVYALQLADAGLRKAGVLPDLTMPTPTLSDIPFVKAFTTRYPSASAQSVQDFYERSTQMKMVYDTIQAKAKEGDIAAVEKEMKFAPNAMVQLDDMKTTLGRQSQLIRQIYQNPDMSASDKRQLIDSIYFGMIQVAHAGNAALDAAEKALAPPVVK